MKTFVHAMTLLAASTCTAVAGEVLSPELAVKQPIGRMVTAEFRVVTATSGRYTDNNNGEPQLIFLSPGLLLANQSWIEVVLTSRVVAHLNKLGLTNRNEVDRFFERRLVRVTGRLDSLGPREAPLYRLQVDDVDALEIVGVPLR